MGSMLSAAMDNTTQHDFVLQTPEPGSRYYLKCQIYFFDTPSSLTIKVGYNEKTRDVIRHIMTQCRHSAELHDANPLQYPDNPERYSLYFIDDDESEHAPDYDMGPRNLEEPIGEFPTLAFIVNRNYREASNQLAGSQGSEVNTQHIQTEEEKKALEAQDKTLLIVQCNTVLLNKVTHTVIMDNS